MGIRTEYYGKGLRNGRYITFHWISTAANLNKQLEFIKQRLGIEGNISYGGGSYADKHDPNVIELGEIGSNF